MLIIIKNKINWNTSSKLHLHLESNNSNSKLFELNPWLFLDSSKSCLQWSLHQQNGCFLHNIKILYLWVLMKYEHSCLRNVNSISFAWAFIKEKRKHSKHKKLTPFTIFYIFCWCHLGFQHNIFAPQFCKRSMCDVRSKVDRNPDLNTLKMLLLLSQLF